MQYLGQTLEDIERYYSKLSELAEPRLSEVNESMIRDFKEYEAMSTTPEERDGWKMVVESILAMHYVVFPLWEVERFRSSVIFYNMPWPSLSSVYHGGHHPILSFDEIYDGLLWVSDSNRDLIFRSLLCSFDQKIQLSASLNAKDKEGFLYALCSLRDPAELSDICWEVFGYDVYKDGRETLSPEDTSIQHSLGNNLKQQERTSVLPKEISSMPLTTEEEAQIRENMNRMYLDGLQMAEKQYKSFKEACLDILASHKEHPYTPRETAIYQAIYARPEGDFIRERFEKEYADEILQKAKEIWPLGAKPVAFSPEENSDEDGLHWPADKVFHRHVITNVHTDYYSGSLLGSPSALRMSIIYKLFRFLVNQGKLGNTQDNLMLFTFRLTGKNPYAIETNRKLVWLGPQSDYSLCYFVWRLFSEIVDVDGKERSKQIASKFWARTGDFFIYADGGVFDANDEQSRRQDFSKGRDLTDPFAKALRKELSVLIEEQASLESK